MITHCIECDTYFHVGAEQLKAANGQVKCGCCMTVFNALESLLDGAETSDYVSIGTVDSASSEADQEELTKLDETSNTEEFIPISVPEAALISDEESETDEIENNEFEIVADEDEALPDEDIEVTSDERMEFDLDQEPVFGESIQDDVEELEKNPSRMWLIASLLIFALLLFQFLNFNAGVVVAKFPQLGVICSFIACPVEQELKDNPVIELISRDVREHPQFKNVLLVNATLMNGANERQPFPKLQIDLFDKVGRGVGSRQFSPNEYLDSSVDLNVGMKPKLPVHIVLEILGSVEEANSFEFTFL